MFDKIAHEFMGVAAILNFASPEEQQDGKQYGSPLGGNPDAPNNPYWQLGFSALGIFASIGGGLGAGMRKIGKGIGWLAGKIRGRFGQFAADFMKILKPGPTRELAQLITRSKELPEKIGRSVTAGNEGVFRKSAGEVAEELKLAGEAKRAEQLLEDVDAIIKEKLNKPWKPAIPRDKVDFEKSLNTDKAYDPYKADRTGQKTIRPH
jgi:hypothetical protein